MLRVAILGCGPAGLIAAEAVSSLGCRPLIVSRKQKSPLYGAQYLHEPIKLEGEYPPAPVTVTYKLEGPVDGYRRKVYGDLPGGMMSSVEALEPDHPAWDLRATYDRLWVRWQGSITHADLGDLSYGDPIKAICDNADIVISSVPRPLLCRSGHRFSATQVWAAGEAPDLGISLPIACPANTVICNGNPAPSWYRISNIYGHKTVEWPHSVPRPPYGKPSIVHKPVDTNCDCCPDIVHVGRYGTWRKGVLSHEAWSIAFDAVKNHQQPLF